MSKMFYVLMIVLFFHPLEGNNFPFISKNQEGYIINETFNSIRSESFPNNWVLQEGNASVQEIPFPQDKSLRLETNQSTELTVCEKHISKPNGIITLELKAKTQNTTGIKYIPRLCDEFRQPIIGIAFRDNKIIAEAGSETKSIQDFTADTWYIIRIVINSKSQTYDLYIDGIKKLSKETVTNSVGTISAIICSIENKDSDFLYVDNLKVFTYESLVGKPPEPVFDITEYGAVGDGKTLNTQAIQSAIEACAGSGGSVYIPQGTFISGTIRLKSDMTLFVSPDATLFGSDKDNDYPPQNHSSKSIHTLLLQKALIYAENEKNIRIDGGGTIDGNGSIKQWKMNGGESKRPILFYPVKCNNISVQNVYFKDAAMWCFVPLETNNVTVRNLYIDSRDYGNRDGIDLTNTHNVLIENCTLNTDDDSICPKSGIESGVQNILVRDCYLVGSVRANGIKFGTASYGQFKNMHFEDILIKNCDKSAIALESVDGATIENITFRRIEMEKTNSPFYMIIGKRQTTPEGSPKKIGTINKVLFEDVIAKNLNSKIGCPISGLVDNKKEYPITNVTFKRCNITFSGGKTDIPKLPPEMETQYPECNIWGDMPAYGYFIRHAQNIQFIDCKTDVSPEDKRPWRTLENVKNLSDTNVSFR